MPLYEYHCKDCDKAFELIKSYSESVEAICPECGRVCTKELSRGGSFRLEGSGWYSTGYQKK